MTYGVGRIDGDAGTGAATLRSTNGDAVLGAEDASAITGADGADAIADIARLEATALRDGSPDMLLLGAVDASCFRAMLIGIEVDAVAAGSVGFDERLTTDASGVCCMLRVSVESALRMTKAGTELAVVGVAVRMTEGDLAVSRP
jgi:hypothetical protein